MTTTQETAADSSATGVTQEDIELANKVFCIPVTLLLNFGLFQFLLSVFYKRRHEPTVRMLLFVAFLSFASLVPGAHPDHHLVRDLNDISEVCSVLSFLLQITILTRDVNKKVKLPTVMKLARLAEMLVVLGLFVLVTNFIDIVAPVIDIETVELLDHIVEYISLVFVVAFRFYFLAMARGAAKVWEKQKVEVLYYVLLATHTLPFYVISHATGLDWHHVQGLWMRCTIAMCLSSTIRARIASMNSKSGLSSHAHSSNYDKSDGPSAKILPGAKAGKSTSICPSPPTLPAKGKASKN